jgi:hypothetical protein
MTTTTVNGGTDMYVLVKCYTGDGVRVRRLLPGRREQQRADRTTLVDVVVELGGSVHGRKGLLHEERLRE